MSKNILPGKKVGRPVVARFMKSQNTGTLGMEIQFAFMEPSTGITETLNWVAWLTETSIERSMDTLVNTLGFNGNDSQHPDGILSDPTALAYGIDVELVVEHEEYKGKYYPKIKWINKMGGGKFSQCTPETIKSELETIGFKGFFLAAKQNKEAEVELNENVPF